MNHEELFLKEGAWYHCARLIYRNKDVGLRDDAGHLTLTPEGADIYAKLSDVTDVEVKPARKVKVKAEAQIVEPVATSDLDDLINGPA